MKVSEYLFKDVFPGEFHLEGAAAQEVLHGEGRDLHDVADVQAVDPLLLVQVAQQVLHVHFCAYHVPFQDERVLFFHGHAFLQLLDNGEHLDGGLLEEGEAGVVDDADLLQGLALE